MRRSKTDEPFCLPFPRNGKDSKIFMARTPLLRQLQKLCRNLSCTRSGADPGLSGCRSTRRDVLKWAGTGALTLAVGRHASAGSRKPRVVIVGGGIAGLAAALTLKDAGFSTE